VSTVVTPLFADGGFVNPTGLASRFLLSFFDSATGRFLPKQSARFDGGWRWYESDMAATITIYSLSLNRMAFADITHEELEDSWSPEFMLFCAQSRVLVDHNAFETKFWLIDKIRADFRQLRQELGIPYVKPVRPY